MTFQPMAVYIVSHTHWDREWYLTYHTFRVNMLRVVKQVLGLLENDKSFKHFLLDGQSVLLEDYLEIYPEEEERIKKLVKSGALSVGPWYILPDEFIISAESHVRNLFYGHKVSLEFGKVNKAGYIPDSFGHIAQMPQILKQGDINSFIFTRGSGDELDELGYEFIWQAPDGSEVLTVHQCGGYCSGGALGFDELWLAHTRRTVNMDRAKQQIHQLFENMSEFSNGKIVLLNNGCDHLPPQQDFGLVLNALKEEFPNTEFIHTGLEDYVDAVRKAGFATKKYSGEMIRGKYHVIIPGVWSTRMYLKQKNDEAQNLLSNYMEPVSAYSHFMLGGEYPSGLIEYAWKLLLKNHPHDSICGCSTDEVHNDMVQRFDGVIQTSHREMINQLENLTPTFARNADDDKHTTICLMNTLPYIRTEMVERIVVLQPFGFDPEDLHLIDEQGNEIPFLITQKWYVRRFWEVDYRTILESDKQIDKFESLLDEISFPILKSEAEKDVADCFFKIQFIADLPPMSHVKYRLVEKPTGEIPKVELNDVKVEGSTIENKYCKVDVYPNGSFDLLDKVTGRQFKGLNILEDTEDIGDEYDYSHCENSSTVTTENADGLLTIIENSGLKGTIEADFAFELPDCINDDRKTRSEESSECPVSVRISLRQGSPVVDIDVRFLNLSEDHRLRARFMTPFRTDKLISDGHFYVNERPFEQPSGEGWVQPPAGTYPQQDFSLLQDNEGGLAVFNRGLPEIEAIRNKDGNSGMALTLLRSVGWLSRDDFPTRCFRNAGPSVATPDAQCLGDQRFHYAVTAFQGDWINAGIKQRSQSWRVPPLMIQGVEDLSTKGGIGLVELTSNCTCITTIKKHDSRDTLVIRLYNLTTEPSEETLHFGKDINKAYQVNLLEERGDEIQVQNMREISISVNKHQILSIEVVF